MQQSTKTENHRKTYGFKRKEGDSNPRYAFDVYTLSRRASSATRAPFLYFGMQKYQFLSEMPHIRLLFTFL